MTNSAPCILAVVAGIVSIIGIIKPAWPLTAMAVFILAVAVFVAFYRG